MMLLPRQHICIIRACKDYFFTSRSRVHVVESRKRAHNAARAAASARVRKVNATIGYGGRPRPASGGRQQKKK